MWLRTASQGSSTHLGGNHRWVYKNLSSLICSTTARTSYEKKSGYRNVNTPLPSGSYWPASAQRSGSLCGVFYLRDNSAENFPNKAIQTCTTNRCSCFRRLLAAIVSPFSKTRVQNFRITTSGCAPHPRFVSRPCKTYWQLVDRWIVLFLLIGFKRTYRDERMLLDHPNSKSVIRPRAVQWSEELI